MVRHPNCPTKGCQDVFIGVLGKDGWDKVSDSCPKCGTALKEGRKLVTECFPHYTLQAELEYLFSLDGQLMEDQQTLCSEQRQCNAQMERLTYLQDMNPGKILCHLLNGLCYQVNNHSVQHEITCAITCALNEPLATIFIVFYFFWLWIFSVWSLMDCGLGLKYPNRHKMYVRTGTVITLFLSLSSDVPILRGKVHCISNVCVQVCPVAQH
ncbi:hypothetical protein CNAG_07358 [Cryptococcus neoformans var. grubii H99]|uniref:Uncharacterized protein n=1 Tax=Cryptococcus neoformans (strain H99 / ATCC 208821 / CBS 10515 / FGSC 9487) TaxID=235443 RepID=J9VLF6_CRYN9|nr:hypothetical protein CNAG_07358 [Cryptococcus neoformans var. grubii H99]AFR92515.2 hypothetical protein CNAG_07358 [Cryptococcus neoformans var. grubii H99]AUB21955.1 hypothetical protein CKF44_07358 [Cryptococcus neoformans var. grubii]|eukprot:XP_012046287.1 hypothetical protein CNAG_07358 [Cryptococcus neoformans var. grubii H99]